MHKLEGSTTSAETGSLTAAGQQTDGDAVYFAKYLTSPKLFDLQLSDIQFRRKVRSLLPWEHLAVPQPIKVSVVLSYVCRSPS